MKSTAAGSTKKASAARANTTTRRGTAEVYSPYFCNLQSEICNLFTSLQSAQRAALVAVGPRLGRRRRPVEALGLPHLDLLGRRLGGVVLVERTGERLRQLFVRYAKHRN